MATKTKAATRTKAKTKAKVPRKRSAAGAGPARVTGANVRARARRRGGDKRSAILDAALDLFERKGYEATAVPEIAERAGVAIGTIYRYFATKDEIVNALFHHWKGSFNAFVLGEVPGDLSIEQQFSVYWRRMTEFARNHPRALRFLELHHHAPYLDKQARDMERAYIRVADAVAAEGRKAGRLRPISGALLTALTFGTLIGLLKVTRDGRVKLDDRLIGEAEACLWDAVRAR